MLAFGGGFLWALSVFILMSFSEMRSICGKVRCLICALLHLSLMSTWCLAQPQLLVRQTDETALPAV